MFYFNVSIITILLYWSQTDGISDGLYDSKTLLKEIKSSVRRNTFSQ